MLDLCVFIGSENVSMIRLDQSSPACTDTKHRTRHSNKHGPDNSFVIEFFCCKSYAQPIHINTPLAVITDITFLTFSNIQILL